MLSNKTINPETSMEDTLLSVAEQLFLEKGFDGASTTEIAKRAGCNQTLVHYYFRTKQNLFCTIFEKKFLTLYQGFMSFGNVNGTTVQDKLRFLIETHYDLISKDPRLPLLITNEFHRFPQLIEALRERLTSKPTEMAIAFEQELQEEIAKGNIRPISLKDLFISVVSLNIALIFMMPVIGVVYPMDENQKKAFIDHRRAENVDFVLKSLRP